MYHETARYRVEDEAELAALAAFDPHAWLAGEMPGMSREAVAAREAMIEAHSDPYADPGDVAQAQQGYHAACLGQASDLVRAREAAAARIAELMRAVRAGVEAESDESTEREQTVTTGTRTHVGVIHACIHAERQTSERATAGRKTGS